jgi:fibronectin-binding autotransporter adhesin
MDFLGVVGSGGRGISGGGLVGRGRGIRLSLGVDGGALVGDLGDITVVVVGGVGHGLDSAVGKGNLVGSLDVSGGIGVLGSLEVSLGVVISNTVLESIGGGLLLALNIGSRGVVGSGGRGVGGLSYNNGGSVVGRGGVDNGSGVVGGGVDNGGGVVGGSMDEGSGVVGGTVDEGSGVHDGVATVVGDGTVGGGDLGQTLGVVGLVDGGVAGAESLGHLDGSHLTVSLKIKKGLGMVILIELIHMK